MIVNAAARVMSVAGAGEVLVPAAVGGIAAAVVAAIAIVILSGRETPDPGEPSTALRSFVELDAETGSQRQRIDVPNPGRPELFGQTTAMAAGQGAVWTEAPAAFRLTLIRVDPRHGEIRQVVVGRYSFAFSVVTAFDAVSTASERLERINPATLEHREVLQLPFPEGGLGGTSLAADGDHLWIGTSDGLLLRIDPSGEVSDERTVTDSIQLVAAGAGGVWVVDELAGIIRRIDPQTLRPSPTCRSRARSARSR